MISAQFDYVAPAQLDEAVAFIARDESAKVLAGGQNLLLDLRQRKLSPSLLVDLRNIPTVIAVVSEKEKAKAIFGALRTRIIHILITDSDNAMEVLRMNH